MGGAVRGGGGGAIHGGGKKPKNRTSAEEKQTPPSKRIPFPRRGVAVAQRGGTHHPYVSEIIIFVRKKRTMMKINLRDTRGLTMKDGRLQNERPDGVSGIQHVADMRKMMRREEKISMMETAMYRAEMRADMQEKMGGSCDM